MHPVRLARTLSVAVALSCAVTLTACGSEGSNSPSTATVGTSGAQVDIGDTISYSSFGTTAEIDCADGKALNVAGSNNTLTVTGTCRSVNVGGADNKINLAKVDGELRVIGLNNTVLYRDGEPTIDDVGSGNSIAKG